MVAELEGQTNNMVPLEETCTFALRGQLQRDAMGGHVDVVLVILAFCAPNS